MQRVSLQVMLLLILAVLLDYSLCFVSVAPHRHTHLQQRTSQSVLRQAKSLRSSSLSCKKTKMSAGSTSESERERIVEEARRAQQSADAAAARAAALR
jgi:hypothetical protein